MFLETRSGVPAEGGFGVVMAGSVAAVCVQVYGLEGVCRALEIVADGDPAVAAPGGDSSGDCPVDATLVDEAGVADETVVDTGTAGLRTAVATGVVVAGSVMDGDGTGTYPVIACEGAMFVPAVDTAGTRLVADGGEAPGTVGNDRLAVPPPVPAGVREAETTEGPGTATVVVPAGATVEGAVNTVGPTLVGSTGGTTGTVNGDAPEGLATIAACVSGGGAAAGGTSTAGIAEPAGVRGSRGAVAGDGVDAGAIRETVFRREKDRRNCGFLCACSVTSVTEFKRCTLSPWRNAFRLTVSDGGGSRCDIDLPTESDTMTSLRKHRARCPS
eukprot:GHVQ01005176.1.p2 GENE.GHVQ01005176.1~~GHVQ01005176.1.p2  ORF type:complete len:329 (-),score=59.08 GHVQ01005176.1:157-1143(-)